MFIDSAIIISSTFNHENNMHTHFYALNFVMATGISIYTQEYELVNQPREVMNVLKYRLNRRHSSSWDFTANIM